MLQAKYYEKENSNKNQQRNHIQKKMSKKICGKTHLKVKFLFFI